MENKIKSKIYIFLLLAATLFNSCADFEEMNQNPTTSTDMDPNLMLTTIQMQLSGGRYEQWRNGFIYATEWMQLWTGEYASVEYGGKGQKNDAYMSALWDVQYPREVKNITDMVERTKDVESQTNINAVSRIMRVLIFSRLTDIYGDIPYSQAGKGYYEGILTPVYDRQEDIYNDFFVELAAATSALDESKDAITNDFYFEGDIAKWRKFGNSLRLRLAMRLTKVNPDKARTEAEAAIAGGVLQGNDDAAVMKHIDVAFGGGVFGGNGVSYVFMNVSPSESAFRITSTLGNYMLETSDPRLALIAACYLDDNQRTDVTPQVLANYENNYRRLFQPPSTFVYDSAPAPIVADVAGVETEIAGKFQFMQPAKYFTATNAPYIVMSYAETELWMAEAAFRGWNTGSTAQEHFQRALDAGVKQLTIYGAPAVGQPTIDGFVAANPLESGKELEQINSQLWINFLLNGQEAYANWRRSGYPALVYPNRDPAVNQSNGEIPRRMQYPVNEYLLNNANVEEAKGRMTGAADSWNNRVWWDAE
ncbi:MAG: SusD/RagB family nutrient-binding outer membrane lipoprotein [Bacteroidales bacterium]|nr:SusD/RagB family nutrient-binding outer membrane lipoprotein [Bacteroidales bacterium]